MNSYFTDAELACQETGELEMDKEFLALVNQLRANCGFPFVLTSAYRSPKHSLEAKKEKAGSHAMGCAVDIRCTSNQRYIIMEEAKKLGITRFGVHKVFLHIDIADHKDKRFPPNVVWGY